MAASNSPLVLSSSHPRPNHPMLQLSLLQNLPLAPRRLARQQHLRPLLPHPQPRQPAQHLWLRPRQENPQLVSLHLPVLILRRPRLLKYVLSSVILQPKPGLQRLRLHQCAATMYRKPSQLRRAFLLVPQCSLRPALRRPSLRQRLYSRPQYLSTRLRALHPAWHPRVKKNIPQRPRLQRKDGDVRSSHLQ